MLPRAMRLRRSRDFQAIYRTRRSWATECLALHIRLGLPGTRMGFVISTKVSKRAHDRNLLKRRMREISRVALLPRQCTDADAIFVARKPVLALNYVALQAEMSGLMRQAGLLKTE